MSTVLPGMRQVGRSGIMIRAVPLLEPGVPLHGTAADAGEGRTRLDRILDAEGTLNRLAHGWEPSEPELGSAPVLVHWLFRAMPDGLSLVGRVKDHPLRPDGRIVVTSPLVAVDLGRLAWCRTVSRWYRLGPSLDEEGRT